MMLFCVPGLCLKSDATSEVSINALRCSGVIGPIWLPGGITNTRWVTLGYKGTLTVGS